jgi:glycerate-2-kinase
MEDKFRVLAREMIMAGVRVADPREAIRRNLVVKDGVLEVQGKDRFCLKDYDRILLFGVGKVAMPMCQAFEGIIRPDGGLAISKKGDEIAVVDVQSIPVYRAYHPEPRQENVDYSKQILDMVDGIGANEKVLVFLMISGGGSALFCAPPADIDIADMFTLNELLMKCGAHIHDINTIRKHISLIKGGRFGQRVAEKGATLVSLILSDVVGDDLSVIASGPSYKDGTTFQDAINLMKHYRIWDEAPASIRQHMEAGLENPQAEPPRSVPEHVYNYLIGNNLAALNAARDVARQAGLQTMILTSQNSGEAKVIAKCVMGIAKEIQDSGNPVQPPVALIMGGEMIVTFDWADRDGFGPNREFVLSSALEIQGRRNIVVAGADTDGVDGDGKSGAIADGLTVGRSTLDARWHLDRHDGEAFFDDLGDSISYTSMTNVNDVVVVLVGPKERA